MEQLEVGSKRKATRNQIPEIRNYKIEVESEKPATYYQLSTIFTHKLLPLWLLKHAYWNSQNFTRPQSPDFY
jgi:hypothetical protein